ncbi:PLC-like phosphodiesterase [Cantharellus anzutake]|uniref:PLC-like phosphodiesterase n=1 Tax=Cantharellus anzutake TaxID=1750568 RepID=UPI00190752D2|nr:PLC-like phosphodiesterase [Cantharellus anzutake]KAF8331518.1 PLC-like phosphodiesterase [Cantharellus anzutake]
MGFRPFLPFTIVAAILATISAFFLYFLGLAHLSDAYPVSGGWIERTLVYDIQGHRGGRGHTIENTIPSFAWGLINGATSLEMDNGITKDGHVVVWHDEKIDPTKCMDTQPVTPGDPMFPYVEKYIAQLTLAQLKTLDCGSERLSGYPLQIAYPGTRISTLRELFSFLECADPEHKVWLNIESKIDARYPNLTKGVDDFVNKQHAIFVSTPYYKIPGAITFQSFDWRTLIGMRKKDASIILSALVDGTTYSGPNNTVSPWLAGINPKDFPGPTLGEQLAQAAHSIGAHILSASHAVSFLPLPNAVAPDSTTSDPTLPGHVAFTTKEMVDEAHKLGMQVKPWTVNVLNSVKQLVTEYNVDGIITDYPWEARRWAIYEAGIRTASPYPQEKVLKCLAKHNQADVTAHLHGQY